MKLEHINHYLDLEDLCGEVPSPSPPTPPHHATLLPSPRTPPTTVLPPQVPGPDWAPAAAAAPPAARPTGAVTEGASAASEAVRLGLQGRELERRPTRRAGNTDPGQQ